MAGWKDRLAQTAQRNRQEIVRAKLSRRDMMRLGLLTAGGSLAIKGGLSSRAYGQVGVGAPRSPPTTPWAQAMPRVPVKQPVAAKAMSGGVPDGSTPVNRGTRRVNHQLCSYSPGSPSGYGGAFPPQKFYELFVKEAGWTYHPTYSATTIWGFDGRVPGPHIQARYGEPILVRYHNHLPSVRKPQNFGIAEITTHLHNAHTPTESDGNPIDSFNSINDPTAGNPLGFKDQHYPNVYAGYTALGNLVGDPREGLGSLWYHDHHHDFTAQNVYKGMAGIYTLFDHLDTGNEATGLRLPSGSYDVPIMFTDPLFDRDCQLVFDLFDLDGILGDKFAANGAIQPYLNVDKRRYRFRLYNPGPSRFYEFMLYDGVSYLPFWQISSDGNLLPQAVPVNKVRLGMAERADIIVDFSKVRASKLYLVNRLNQLGGRKPEEILLTPGQGIIEFRVGAATPDYSRDPAIGGPFLLRELPDPDMGALLARADRAKKRRFVFGRLNGNWTVNGQAFDEDKVFADPDQESEEVWTIRNEGGGWHHPIHPHFEEFRVLSYDGRTIRPNTQVEGNVHHGRKDVMTLGDGREARIFVRFRDLRGRYVMHCHNTVHEDHGMMIRFDIK